MDGASALTAFSSVLTSTVKFAEKAFEYSAVDAQSRAVLQTVTQVSSQLRDAKTLRRQKSALFTTFEKRMFDDTFQHTDEAIQQVAGLAERARADMEVTGGRVKPNTRLLFVLRDSPNIHVSLTKLGIASQSLNMAIFTLTNREGRSSIVSATNASPPLNQGELRPPPTYEESMFLSEGRQRNMRRRESAMSLNARARSTSPLPIDAPLPESLPELCGDHYLSNFIDYKDSPSITVTDATPQTDGPGFNLLRQSNDVSSNFDHRPRSRNEVTSLQTDISDFNTCSNFCPPPLRPRQRAWSGRADLQPDEQSMEAILRRNHSSPSLPAPRCLSGSARRHRWLESRCQ